MSTNQTHEPHVRTMNHPSQAALCAVWCSEQIACVLTRPHVTSMRTNVRHACGNVSAYNGTFTSYATDVARVFLWASKAPVLVVTSEKYSATTSKQLSLLESHWNMALRAKGASNRDAPTVVYLPDLTELPSLDNIGYACGQAEMWLTAMGMRTRKLTTRIAALHQFDNAVDLLGRLVDMREAYVGGSGFTALDQSLSRRVRSLNVIHDGIATAAPLPALDAKTEAALNTVTTLRGIAALEI